MMRNSFGLLLGLALATGGISAQRPDRPGGNRPALEARLQNRIREVMRLRLGLTEDQVARLDRTNRRFEPRRRALLREEMELRRGLRGRLAGPPTDSMSAEEQGEVSRMLERAIRLQREKLDLIEEEQRDLAEYLTPAQRARYFGLQEQIREQVERLRQDGAGPPPEGRPFRGRGPGVGRRPPRGL